MRLCSRAQQRRNPTRVWAHRGRAGLGLLGVALVLLAPPGPARAVDAVSIEVLVSVLSAHPGTIDPRGHRIDAKLRDQLRYESLRVLEQADLQVGIGELASLELPNGSWLRVRPSDVSRDGVLLHVDVEGLVRTDLRVRNGHLVVYGPVPHGDGKLVISLEPRW
ncbi:hypothetical protein MK489_21350 [Myxococcota bacterium]|nr:hypothetical protein [Myxococcota bacterium]